MVEAFTREKDSRIEKIEGSGLGMSISKWIVDQMGGTIAVSYTQLDVYKRQGGGAFRFLRERRDGKVTHKW